MNDDEIILLSRDVIVDDDSIVLESDKQNRRVFFAEYCLNGFFKAVLEFIRFCQQRQLLKTEVCCFDNLLSIGLSSCPVVTVCCP